MSPFPAFGPDHWVLESISSVSGDLAAIDLLRLPHAADHAPIFCEIEQDSGSGPIRTPLNMWLATRYWRLIRVAPDRETTVRLRMIFGTATESGEDTATQLMAGPWSAPKTVRPLRGEPVLALDATRRVGIAPAGIMFTANAIGTGVLRPYHDVRYRWSFGDPGSYRNLSSDLPWERDRNVAFGPVVAHTFEGPGEYTVTCEATDGNTTLVGEIRVLIEDPGRIFSGVNTVCVSQRGDFTDAPPGAVLVSSMDRAHTVLETKRDARLLLRRGEEFRPSRSTRAGYFTAFSSLQVGAFGRGAAPVWRDDGGQGGGLTIRYVDGEVSVWGLNLQGPYDAGRPESTIRPERGIELLSGQFRTVHGCRLSGWSTSIYVELEHSVISDCAITNWFNYGVFQPEGGWLGLAGCSVRQSPLAPNDAGKFEQDPPFIPDHGPYRLSRPTAPCCFNLVDMFSCNSWAGKYGHQPCIRWNASGVADPQKLNVDRARTEGSTIIFHPNSNRPRLPQEIVLDKFHHVTTAQSLPMEMHWGGTTVRNGVLVQPNYPAESNTMREFFYLTAAGTNIFEPSAVYNCTVVDQRIPENAWAPGGRVRPFRMARLEDPAGTVAFGNHVAHAPAMIDGTSADMPLDATPRWRPLYQGRRLLSERGGALQTEYANPPEAGALFAPLAGSPAIGDADPNEAPVALDDFFGRLRGSDPSRGALEPE